MQPIMLTELLKSYHREQVENHKKLARMRRFDIRDHVQITVEPAQSVASSSGPLMTKIGGWLSRMRPVRAN